MMLIAGGTGRMREDPHRRGEFAGLSAGFGDGAALRAIALVADDLASGIPERYSWRRGFPCFRAAGAFAAGGRAA